MTGRWRKNFGTRLRLFLTAWFGFVALVVVFLLMQALPAFYESRYDVRWPVCTSPADPDRAHAFLEQSMRDAGVARWSLGDGERPLQECTGYDYKLLQFDAVLRSREAGALFDHIRTTGPVAGVHPRALSYQNSPAGAGGCAYAVAALVSALLALGFWWIVRRRGTVREGARRSDIRKVLWSAAVAAGLALVAAVTYGFLLQAAGIIRMPERSNLEAVTPLLLLTATVLAPIVEEVIFRFWLLARMVPAIGPVAALVLSSVLFSLVHMEVEPFAFGSRLLTGLALGLLWLRIGSLRACVLAHGLFNAVVIGLDQLL